MHNYDNGCCILWSKYEFTGVGKLFDNFDE